MNQCTVNDVIDAIAPNTDDSGVCATTALGRQRIIRDLDLALEALMKRIDSNGGTLFEWAIPVSGGCFSLPEDCKEIRQVWVNGYTAKQRGFYYQGQIVSGKNTCGTQCCQSEVIDLGDFVIPRPLPNIRPIYITLAAESNADAGQVVKVEIINDYGERIVEDLTMLTDQQKVSMSISAKDVTFVGKPQTNGPIKMYLRYDNGQDFYLCEYGPRVQSGAFRRKKLPAWCPYGCNLIRLVGKRRYYRINSINDIIPICDRNALKFAMMAQSSANKRDLQGYNENLSFAVNEILKGLEDADSPGCVQPVTVSSGFCGDSWASGGRCWS